METRMNLVKIMATVGKVLVRKIIVTVMMVVVIMADEN